MEDENNLKEEIKSLESDVEASLTLSEVCRFMIFSILFVVIILNQISTETSYNISAGITQALLNADPTDVLSDQDVID